MIHPRGFDLFDAGTGTDGNKEKAERALFNS
jgi:hypothetical protein